MAGKPKQWRALDCALASSEKWAAATNEGRVLWIQILLRCDNYGATDGDAHVLWVRLTKRLGWTKAATVKALANLVKIDLVHVWKDPDEGDYLHIVDFDERQCYEFIRRRGPRRSPEHHCPADAPAVTPDIVQEPDLDQDGDIDKDPENICGQVRSVFGHWALKEAETGGIKSAKLTDGRRKRIQARLNEGYTVEQLTQAIDGFLTDDFHLGKHKDNKTRYTSIDTVLKSGDKVEAGIVKAAGSTAGRYDYLNGNGSSDDIPF